MLEQLFLSSSHVDGILDETTSSCDRANISRRVDKLLRIVLRRIQTRGKEELRSAKLQYLLGAQMYQEIADLVQEIKLLRLQQYPIIGGPSTTTDQDDHFPIAPMTIPSPVKNLYFKTKLVSAFEEMSPAVAARQDWDALVLQAERNIQEYLNWINSPVARAPPDTMPALCGQAEINSQLCDCKKGDCQRARILQYVPPEVTRIHEQGPTFVE